jgi:hypothetical protein
LVFEKYGINKDFDDNSVLASYYVVNHNQGNLLGGFENCLGASLLEGPGQQI